MESQGIEGTKKRAKPSDEVKGLVMEGNMEEETLIRIVGSAEMEMQIQLILEKIERFTQQVSEMLEAGKTMFQELSIKFEERLIEIHTEQIQKWQEEIKELRLMDGENEETHTLLQNTRSHLLQNCQVDC